MKDKQYLALVRGKRLANKTGRGGRSYTPLKGLMNYIMFGRYADQLEQPEQQRGIWLDHQQHPQTHDEVLRWAKEKVHRYGYEYAYQLLLSTRYGGLETADFNRALQVGSAINQVQEWRYMVHHDTPHQHAHVILFSREKLTAAQYREWQQAMQAELAQMQNERGREQQHQLEPDVNPRHPAWEVSL